MPKTKSWIEGYCYVIIFLLIYLEWGYAPVVAQSIPGIAKTALMIVSVVPLCFFKSFRIKVKSFVLFAYFTIIIVISALRDIEIGNSILLFVPIFCAFIFTSGYSAGKAIRAFCNIITFLSAYSLVFYTLTLLAPSILSPFPILPNPFNIPIHNLGFAVMPTGMGIIRNYGITWEPGAFALLICIAIYCQIVGYKTLNRKRIIINIIALITTFSTMGFVVLAAIILITRFRTSAVHNSASANVLLLLFLGVSIYFLLGPSSELYDVVFSKLSGFSIDSENTQTTQARLNAIIYPGEAFLSSPIIGVGYDVFKNINATLCDNVATNTIVNWFAILGIALGLPCSLYYFKAILKAADYLDLNLLFKFSLVVAFSLLISTESLLRISLIYVIIFYGCSTKKLIKDA